MMFLGLASFILMDMLSGKTSVFGGGNQNDAGSVNGRNISWAEFQTTENVLSQNNRTDPFQRRKAIWDYFVEKSIVDSEAESLGLVVSRDELLDLEFGQNLSPIIIGSFSNPQTRQVNRESLNQYKTAIEENTLPESARQFWSVQEKQIIKERLQSKLSNMVEKAMFTPSWMVEELEKEQNQNVSLEYVKIPFDAIPDAQVTVSDNDLSAYLKDHKAEFINKVETRKVNYVAFDIVASSSDSSAILKDFMTVKSDFMNSENDSSFVAINSGIMNNGYITKDQVNANIAEGVFSQAVGTVFGPIVEGSNYNLTKVLDRRMLPDSAKSRHILISAQTPAQFAQAFKTIDSLKLVIENGTTRFDSLATKFSQDPGSASKGGVYDYVGLNQFVPEYRDIIFYKGKIGSLYTVRTTYGVHLIEPQGRKGEEKEYVKIASVFTPIIPTDKTIADVFDIASSFINTNKTLSAVIEAAQSKGMIVKTSAPLAENDFKVGDLKESQSSRDIAKWSFKNSVGSVSPSVYAFEDPVNYYTNKYVVVGLKNIQSAGLPSVANIKEELEPLVRNAKKGDILKGKITSSDLNQIANTYATEIAQASDIKFNSSFVTGMGTEPKVIAKSMTMADNTVSKPIIGENGVYVIKVLSNKKSGSSGNIAGLRKQFNNKYSSAVKSQLINAVKDKATITDNRSTYY